MTIKEIVLFPFVIIASVVALVVIAIVLLVDWFVGGDGYKTL